MKHDVCHLENGEYFKRLKEIEGAIIFESLDPEVTRCNFVAILPDWPIAQHAYSLVEAENFARGMR